MDKITLCSLAVDARQNAHAPYSNYPVGAALLCSDGKVYTGCNIENAAYGSTVCAERVALFKAVSEGDRGFSAIAIAGGDLEAGAPPCGSCRQALAEFCNDSFIILVVKDGGASFDEYTLGELLPSAFRLN